MEWVLEDFAWAVALPGTIMGFIGERAKTLEITIEPRLYEMDMLRHPVALTPEGILAESARAYP